MYTLSVALTILRCTLRFMHCGLIETRFLELAMSLLDISPWIPFGTFSILILNEVAVVGLCSLLSCLTHIWSGLIIYGNMALYMDSSV